MRIWPPESSTISRVEEIDREIQFKIKYGFLPGKIMKHGLVTIVELPEHPVMWGKRIGDRVYTRSLYAYLLEQYGVSDDAFFWIWELYSIRMELFINRQHRKKCGTI
jgi:hypothetical protein